MYGTVSLYQTGNCFNQTVLILYQISEPVVSTNQRLFISTSSIMKQADKNLANHRTEEYLMAQVFRCFCLFVVVCLFFWLASQQRFRSGPLCELRFYPNAVFQVLFCIVTKITIAYVFLLSCVLTKYTVWLKFRQGNETLEISVIMLSKINIFAQKMLLYQFSDCFVHSLFCNCSLKKEQDKIFGLPRATSGLL